VYEMETEKIGIVGWYLVKRHSRGTYIILKREDVDMYQIEPGDMLKVEIQAIRRGPREEG